MMLDLLIIFIVIDILLLILSIFTMDENAIMAVIFIFAGMVMTAMCIYGLVNVDMFYVGQNATTGDLAPFIYTDTSYGVVYPYIFFFIFIIYLVMFFRVGFNLWKEATETKGELDYRRR